MREVRVYNERFRQWVRIVNGSVRYTDFRDEGSVFDARGLRNCILLYNDFTLYEGTLHVADASITGWNTDIFPDEGPLVRDFLSKHTS